MTLVSALTGSLASDEAGLRHLARVPVARGKYQHREEASGWSPQRTSNPGRGEIYSGSLV